MAGSLQFALPIGTQIGHLEVRQILGSGGFGITYRCHDTKLQSDVAVKEYFPTELAVRGPDATEVRPTEHEGREPFEVGLDRFLTEARTLARFRHPNLVRVHQFLEMHGTAYLVMDYESGSTLLDYIRERERLSEDRIRSLMHELLNGLQVLHEHGFLHHDIKPGNVVLRDDGAPVLIDFGAARPSLKEDAATITRFLSPGYAPIEQYGAEQIHGPWSDLYALGATFYHLITHHAPVEAPQRALEIATNDQETMTRAVDAAADHYSPQLLSLVDWMLAIYPHERPDSASAVRRRLSGEVDPEADTVQVERDSKELKPRSKLAFRGPFWMRAGLAGLIVIVTGLWVLQAERSSPDQLEREAHYVTVGPFRAVGDDAEYLAEGVIESLIAQLGPAPGLFLVRPSPSLRTEWRIEGAVLRQADRIRVTYELFGIDSPGARASGVVDGQLAGLFDLQDSVARKVGELLAGNLQVGAIAIDPANEPSIGAYEAYLRAMVSLRDARTQENLQAALSWLEESLAQDPQFAPALAATCRAEISMYQTTMTQTLFESAEQNCQRAIAIDPELMEARLALARLLAESGRDEEARVLYESAIDEGYSSSDLYLGLADLEYSLSNYEAAEDAHVLAVSRDNKDWRTHSAYGTFLLHLGRLTEAESALTKALEITPFNADVLNDLGVLALYEGDYEMAADRFVAAIEIAPTPEAYSNAGTTYFYDGDYGKAVEMYEQAVLAAPANHFFAGNLADAKRLAGLDSDEEYRSAADLAAAALEVSPNDTLTRAVRALYLARLGRAEEARSELMALDVTRDHGVEVLRNVALAGWLLGDIETGIDALERAVALGYGAEAVLGDPEFADMVQHPMVADLLANSATNGGME